MSSGTPSRSLRERKQQATRERLLGTALELFGARGYEATTMDDIAAGADVSRATVFNYFPRKEEFLLAWVEGRREQIAALLAREQAEGIDTLTRIEHVFALLADRLEADADANRALCRAFLKAGVLLLPGGLRTARIFTETISFGQARADLRVDLDAQSLGRVVFDLYLGALIRWAVADESGPERVESVSLKSQLATVMTLLSRALQLDE